MSLLRIEKLVAGYGAVDILNGIDLAVEPKTVMALIGLAIGGLAAIPLSRLLTGLLFGVEPVDPITICVSAVLLVVVALFAAWIPARTAMSVDPMTALRGD
jgi:ABC-type antimicrobial peptide transport system permease subunit